MLVFGSQLAVILAAVFRRGAFGMFTKEATEVVAVCKAAAGGNVFDFQVITLEQLARVFQTRLGQVFIEPHVPGLLKQM